MKNYYKLFTSLNFLHNLLLYIVATYFLLSCAPTPNSITMVINPSVCLTQGIDQAPVNNPNNAPYCVQVVLQNNNSGQNANNVQVINNGITATYQTIANGVASNNNVILCDPIASGGVCPSGSVNQFANINFYDPNNCATQQGSQVTTLMAGGSCAFYLQISNELYPVGLSPISLQYNYTNANQNYSISTFLLQNTILYATTNTGIFNFLASFNASDNVWESGINSVLAQYPGATNIIKDNVGNLYFNINTDVYQYNGSSISSTTITNPVTNINSLAFDSANNILFAGTNAGIFYKMFTPNALVHTWQLATSSLDSNDIIGISYTQNSNVNHLYAITTSTAYQCMEYIGSLSVFLSCNSLLAPSTITADINKEQSSPNAFIHFYPNALLANLDNFYTGSDGAMYNYSGASWVTYLLTPTIIAPNYGSSIAIFESNIYLGIANNTSENAVYTCNNIFPYSCIPVSSATNNTLIGTANSVVVDGSGLLYVLGSNLNSVDFASAITVNGSFLYFYNNQLMWYPITSNIGSITSGVVASSFASL